MLRFRQAEAADVAELVRLEQAAPTAAHWTRSQYERALRDDAPRRVLLVAEAPNARVIFGFLAASRVAGDWEIENLVVGERWRRNHIAEGLLSGFLGGIPSAVTGSVMLEVRESNSPARRLYEKIGFIVEGRRKDYYRAPDEDCILYRLSLQPGDNIP